MRKEHDLRGERLATPPGADGTYKLYAQSHGRDTPDANIKTGGITVDYAAPTEPTILKVVSSAGENTLKLGEAIKVHVKNMTEDEMRHFEFEYMNNVGITTQKDLEAVSFDQATGIVTLSAPDASWNLDPANTVKLTVYTGQFIALASLDGITYGGE